MGVKLKKITPVQEHRTGVCVWLMPDGSYLGDGDGNFLSLSGEINDFIVEAKMQQAAVYWLGEVAKTGKPRWMSRTRDFLRVTFLMKLTPLASWCANG